MKPRVNPETAKQKHVAWVLAQVRTMHDKSTNEEIAELLSYTKSIDEHVRSEIWFDIGNRVGKDQRSIRRLADSKLGKEFSDPRFDACIRQAFKNMELTTVENRTMIFDIYAEEIQAYLNPVQRYTD